MSCKYTDNLIYDHIVKRDKGLRFYIWLLSMTLFVLNTVYVLAFVFYNIPQYGFSKFSLGIGALGGIYVLFFNRASAFIFKKDDVLLMFFIVYMLFVVSMQVYIYPDMIDNYGRSSHSFLTNSLILNICYILIGYILVSVGTIKKSIRVSLLIQILLLFIVLTKLNGNVVIDYREIRGNYSSSSEVANHLLAGPYIYIALVFSYSLATQRWRNISFLASIVILFVLGGRADLILFILSVFTYEFIKSCFIAKLSKITILILLIGLVFVFLSQFDTDNQLLNRMIFSQGIASDASLAHRVDIFNVGIKGLKNQLFFGNVTEIVAAHGTTGAYIHNILSMWQFYGFIAFLVLVFMLIIGFKRVKFLIKNSEETLSVFISLMFLSTIFGLILAKSVTYVVLWISVGCLWGRYYKKQKFMFEGKLKKT